MTSPEFSSSTDRRRLRSQLRQLRAEAGLTQEQVAEEMDWSLSKVIRIETGAVSVSTNDVRGLLNLYNVADKARIDNLIALARAARQKPWWYAYREHFETGFQSYLDLEAGASSLRFYQPALIPGLLQTEAYARATLHATAPEPLSAEDIDLEIEVRLRRQRTVFDREDPPGIVVLIDEAVLHRTAGDAGALREELIHLDAVSASPEVVIQVVPFTAGALAAAFGAFIILDFDDETETAVYLEGLANVQVVRAQQQVITPYLRLFKRIQSVALSEKESLALIRSVADELR